MAIQRFIPEKPPLEPAVSSVTWKWFFQLYHFIQGLVRPDVIQLVNFTPTSRYFYPCDATAGNITVKLPVVASTEGKTYLFTKIDSSANTITLDVVGSDTIDGASSIVLSTQWTTVELYSNGVNTWIVRIYSTGGATPPSGVSITATTPIIVTPSPILGTGVITHATAGTAGTYGDSTHVPVVTTNATGHVTGVTLATISGGGTGTVTAVTGTAPIVITGIPAVTPNVTVTDFVASGISHARGTVPDPGVTAGTTKFLREDATFAVPPGFASPLTTKGDVFGHSTVDARIPVGSDTQVLTADSSQTLGVKWAPAGVQNTFSALWAYGDGSDGAFTLDGTAVPAWATLAGTTYTMTRDCYMTDLTINSGITLGPVGRRIFGNGTFTHNGTISANGFTGLGATPGNAATGANWFQAATQGGGGGNVGNGTAGVNALNSCVASAGGAGGASGVRTGGAGGSVGIFSSRDGGGRHIASTFPTIYWGTLPSAAQIAAATGGGGGAGDGSTRAGGGGGGGAGIIGIFFKIVAGSGLIQAKGGAGVNGGTGGVIGTGGGGGGGGGALMIITTTANYASLLTIDLTGGAFGLGSTPGANGVVGGTGFTYQMITY